MGYLYIFDRVLNNILILKIPAHLRQLFRWPRLKTLPIHLTTSIVSATEPAKVVMLYILILKIRPPWLDRTSVFGSGHVRISNGWLLSGFWMGQDFERSISLDCFINKNIMLYIKWSRLNQLFYKFSHGWDHSKSDYVETIQNPNFNKCVFWMIPDFEGSDFRSSQYSGDPKTGPFENRTVF